MIINNESVIDEGISFSQPLNTYLKDRFPVLYMVGEKPYFADTEELREHINNGPIWVRVLGGREV